MDAFCFIFFSIQKVPPKMWIFYFGETLYYYGWWASFVRSSFISWFEFRFFLQLLRELFIQLYLRCFVLEHSHKKVSEFTVSRTHSVASNTHFFFWIFSFSRHAAHARISMLSIFFQTVFIIILTWQKVWEKKKELNSFYKIPYEKNLHPNRGLQNLPANNCRQK